MYADNLLWVLKSVNIIYFGLFGSQGSILRVYIAKGSCNNWS